MPPVGGLPQPELCVGLARLRAALRLLLTDQDADAVAAHVLGAPSDLDALRRVAHALDPRYSVARLARGSRQRDGADMDAPPLGPQTRAPARAALALALHVGLGAGGALFAEVLQVAPEQVGLLLDQARRAAYPALAPSCPEYASLVGRCADRTLDNVDAAKLVRHARGCGHCRAALESRRWIDEELRARIDALQRALPPGPLEPVSGLRRMTISVAQAAGVVVLVVILAIVGSLAAARCSSAGDEVAARSSEPAVVVAARRSLASEVNEDAEDSHWLVAGLCGRVELISADGRKRVALSPEGTTTGRPRSVALPMVWYQRATGDEGRVMAVEVW